MTLSTCYHRVILHLLRQCHHHHHHGQLYPSTPHPGLTTYSFYTCICRCSSTYSKDRDRKLPLPSPAPRTRPVSTQSVLRSNGFDPNTTYASAEKVYNLRVAEGTLENDPYQVTIMQKLDEIQAKLENYIPPQGHQLSAKVGSFFTSIFKGTSANAPEEAQSGDGKDGAIKKPKYPKGLYIYGAVGGGKTMLMDLFYELSTVKKKKRVHFHSFMSDVHQRIHLVKQDLSFDFKSGRKPRVYDPIPPVAAEIAQEAWLLCFDEFQVTDIGDAMVLKRLFTELFKINGVVVIATSNRPPDDLYKNGLQRSNFVPFIQILKDHCDVISLDSGIDYRQKRLPSTKDRVYFVTNECDADAEINRIFKFLCSKENDTVRPKTLTIKGRNVTFEKTCGQIVDSTFEELCDRPVGASDYLRMAQFFHTVIIRNVPQLNLRLKSQARRFITLIDTLYDNRVRVVISSHVPYKELFSSEPMDEHEDEEQRRLMDDLGISAKSEHGKASIFTGEEEIFAYDRTMSRLAEMQTKEYWDEWEKHR